MGFDPAGRRVRTNRLILDQIAGDKELNAQADRGPVKSPLLLWGPYLWANGATPRKADDLTYTREDLAGDGTHPSTAGREKVARLLLEFFKTDPLARPWFAPRRQPADGLPGEAPTGGSNR